MFISICNTFHKTTNYNIQSDESHTTDTPLSDRRVYNETFRKQ